MVKVEKKPDIEEGIEAMKALKALKQEKLDELRQAYMEKKAEVKVLHYSPESKLGEKLEAAKMTGEAVGKGGLKYVVKREKKAEG
ncbi:MAG: hypothetical protein WC759_03105 [Candidatus Micrarchaeia archaeon]|jgi:hypothetical protein